MKGRTQGAGKSAPEKEPGTGTAGFLAPLSGAAPSGVDECAPPGPPPRDGGPDPIDALVADIQRVRPDIDTGMIGCLARMKWLIKLISGSADEVLRDHNLGPGEFDVLATLRRSGPDCTLIPSQLAGALMMSRAGMTSRLDRLEAASLVERAVDPADRRSFRVRLTEKGRAVIDAAITEHARVLNRFGQALSPEQQRHLDEALRTLLRVVS
jgi:DNA-binding MarR family transcriptional regulator